MGDYEAASRIAGRDSSYKRWVTKKFQGVLGGLFTTCMVTKMRRILIFAVIAFIGLSTLAAFALLKIAEHQQDQARS